MLHLHPSVTFDRGAFLSFLLIGSMGCGPSAPSATGTANPVETRKMFVVVPAESDAFPLAARATTERLRRARVKGFQEPEVSKVSLEVVQLSIECVEPTPTCYEAVGKELSASQLLFAEIDPGPKRDQVKVTVTLFDVEGRKRKRAVAKIFATEDDVPFGVADVVSEATKP
ncbi:MAG: hypothetical protein JWP01_11 [Myxococcales bacterium]|nr:hypothetical protein [Myxococcales bacterium]